MQAPGKKYEKEKDCLACAFAIYDLYYSKKMCVLCERKMKRM